MPKNIMSKIKLQMIGMGILMGIFFPLFAGFFVEWIPERKLYFAISCILAGVFVGIINYWIAYYSLYRPVREITSQTLTYANGDLTGECKIKGSDFIGELANSLNKIRNSFRESLTKARLMSDSLSGYMKHFVFAFEQSTTAVHQASFNIETISENSQRQSMEIKNMAAGLQTIIARITSVGELNNIVSSSFRSMYDNVEAGHGSATSTIEALDTLDKKFQCDISTVTKLGQESDKIKDIIKTISSISDETTLLSLNAAIESVRAGEHGRGFSVVAEHIGKLALRTNLFTEEVTKLIAGIQNEIQDIIKSNLRWQTLMDNVKNNSVHTLEILNKSQETTKKAGHDFKTVSKMLEQVLETNEEIKNKLNWLLSKSQGNIKYASGLSENLEMWPLVNESLGQLNSEIDNLKQFINGFKI